MKLLIAAILAAGCHALCFNATRVDDDTEMTASCMDDDTGFEFTYVDLNNTLEYEESTDDMNTRMYDAFLSGVGNGTKVEDDDDNNNGTSVSKRAEATLFWQRCQPDKVAGRCGANYAATWNGGLASFAQSLKAIFAPTQRNNRAYKRPRSVCNKFSQGTICVSWADYYHNPLQTAQINDIVDQCTYVCEQNFNSCEARATTGSKDEFYCVSNRPSGCNAVTDIRPCD